MPPFSYADLQSEQEKVLYYIKTLGGKKESKKEGKRQWEGRE